MSKNIMLECLKDQEELVELTDNGKELVKLLSVVLTRDYSEYVEQDELCFILDEINHYDELIKNYNKELNEIKAEIMPLLKRYTVINKMKFKAIKLQGDLYELRREQAEKGGMDEEEAVKKATKKNADQIRRAN
ncbi:hypothetical protein [Vallitalea guaymasensis]|uniref:hypothetical protein n=1 Tax=Vallitalea guaymasensis TaxID=1185412 RepID=UPI000DE2E63C|nr:hypothetical protein [Vallitalea guaymasensis]